MSDLGYEEIMSRLGVVTGSGGWMSVEAYCDYEIKKRYELIVDEPNIDKLRSLQGEIKGLRSILRLREDVISYLASEDTSAPGDGDQPE